MNTEDYYNEEGGYEIEIWVETTKTLEELESCLSSIIHPLVIEDHKFKLGSIECDVQTVNDDPPVPTFDGVPNVEYSFCITVPKKDYDIWGAIDHHFAFAIAWGLRRRLSGRYLITADCEFFICHSGANLPTYINTCYGPWASGEMVCYRPRNNKKLIELHIPSTDVW